MKMFYKRQMKKALAFAAALTLLSAVIPADLSVSYADETSTKPYIYIDYLGLAERSGNDSRGPSDTKLDTRPAFKTADKGKVFWVGVRVTNLENTSFIRDRGLTSIDVAFDYNSDYIIPADEVVLSADAALAKGSVPVDTEKWKQVIKQFNFTEEGAENNNTSKTLWNSNYYYIDYAAPEATIDTETPGKAQQPEFSNGNAWKTAHLTINKNADEFESNITSRFYSIENGAGYYIIRMPFILLDTPTDGSQPRTLFLSRGPKTLTMEAGGETEDLGYQWEDDGDRRPDVIPARNLKNVFDFGGDLNIFQESDSITNMSFTYPETDDENATPVAITLYKNFDQNGSETIYNPETFVYYISVPKDTKYVDFVTDDTENAPYVEHGDYTSPAAFISVSGITKGADGWHGRVELTGTVSASGQENTPDIEGVPSDPSYKNVIRFTAGEKTYTVHVREKSDAPIGEARIELAPGNSPYGLIERMGEKWYKGEGTAWTEEQIAAAKNDFSKANRFTTNYLPKDADTKVIYTATAWGERNMTEVPVGTDIEKWEQENESQKAYVNYDKDSTAAFAYMRKSFIDPGFKVIDSNGEIVELSGNNVVKRTITWDVMPSGGTAGLKNPDIVTRGAVVESELNGTEGEDIINLTNVHVKPGIYKIEYVYTDGQSTASAIRTLVVIPSIGDVNMDNVTNNSDADVIKLRDTIFDLNNPQRNGSDARVYYYRAADVNKDNVTNNSDADVIKLRALVPFYKAL